jgi:hypothetical protein
MLDHTFHPCRYLIAASAELATPAELAAPTTGLLPLVATALAASIEEGTSPKNVLRSTATFVPGELSSSSLACNSLNMTFTGVVTHTYIRMHDCRQDTLGRSAFQQITAPSNRV